MNNNVVCLIALSLAACASAPPPIAEGEQELEVKAAEWAHAKDPFTGVDLPMTSFEWVEGADCTLSNDKGSWSTRTPGKVRVARSMEPLEFDCTKAGYKRARLKVLCQSPHQQAAQQGKMGTVATLVFVPLAIAAAPVAPQLAAQAVTQALIYAGGAVVSNATLGKDADMCKYQSIGPFMTRDKP